MFVLYFDEISNSIHIAFLYSLLIDFDLETLATCELWPSPPFLFRFLIFYLLVNQNLIHLHAQLLKTLCLVQKREKGLESTKAWEFVEVLNLNHRLPTKYHNRQLNQPKILACKECPWYEDQYRHKFSLQRALISLTEEHYTQQHM